MENRMVNVPDLTGQSTDNAIGILGGKNLKASVQGSGSIVVDQYPKPGERMETDSTVTLYCN